MNSEINTCTVTFDEIFNNLGPYNLWRMAQQKGAPFIQDYNEIKNEKGEIEKRPCKWALKAHPDWIIEENQLPNNDVVYTWRRKSSTE